MGQVNVNYDDRMLAGIDRVAGARGLSRPDLLRAIAGETIDAHDAGRLAFQIEDGPRIDGSINALVVQLREGIVELDRSQRANQRHEKKLLDAWVGSEEVVRAAQENILARVNDINRKSYQPFLGKLADVYTALNGLGDRLTEAQDAKLEKVAERIEAVRAEASKPRTQYSLVLGDDRVLSLGFLSVCAVLVGFLSVMLFLLTASHVSWLGVPVARRMLTETTQVCQVIDHLYGVRNCKVPDDVRTAAIRAAKAGA